MIDVAAAWLVNERGEILICRRAPSQSRAGYWEFPGGKFEAGEDGTQALRRELMEELELEIRNIRLLAVREHRYPNDTFRIHLYRCERSLPQEPRLSVHDDYRFANPEHLLDYKFLEGDIPLIQAILQGEQEC